MQKGIKKSSQRHTKSKPKAGYTRICSADTCRSSEFKSQIREIPWKGKEILWGTEEAKERKKGTY